MTKLDLSHSKPLALYELSSLFAAVAQYRDDLSSEAENHNSYWASDLLASAERMADQLEQWQKAGITHLVSDAPLSDNHITGAIEDTLSSQMRAGRLQPATPDMVRAFGLK